MQGKTLDTLPFDVLNTIIQELYSPFMYNWETRWDDWSQWPPSIGLLPLSSVCKHLRMSTVPWIFRDIRFSVGHLAPFLPRNLWHHVRTFRLDDSSPRRALDLFRNETYELLSQMDQVTIVHFKIYSLSQTLLLTLTSLPNLTSLFFLSLPIHFDHRFMPHQLSHLRWLSVNHTSTLNELLHWEGNKMGKAVGKCLFETACASASALVHLDLLGQFVQLDRMASLLWSSLRTLILRGRLCSKDAVLFSQVLAATPQLSELVMDLIVVSYSTPQFAIYPHDRDIPLHSLPKLRRLTLANVHPLDRIFQYLTDDMVFLSLPAAVVYREDWMQKCNLALSYRAASYILRKCTASNITEFHISISGELPPALLNQVARTFPYLVKFELRHRIEVDENRHSIKTTEYSPEAYASAFSAFLQLQHLNLDWPLTNTANADDFLWAGSTDSPRIDMQNFAILVALNVKSLSSIGFAECTALRHLRMPWRVFVIEHTDVYSGLTAYPVDNLSPEVVAFKHISVRRWREPPNTYPCDPPLTTKSVIVVN